MKIFLVLMLASVAYAESQAFHPIPYHNYPRIIPYHAYATPYQVTPQQATPYNTWYYNPYVNYAASLATSQSQIKTITKYINGEGDEEAVVAESYAAGDKINSCNSQYVSRALKKEILSIHNRERRSVKRKFWPKITSNEKPRDLRWSDALERTARNFIERCDLNIKHRSRAERNGEGENLGSRSSTGVLGNMPDSYYTAMVEHWMAEQEVQECSYPTSETCTFENEPLSSGSNPKGHYTQAIWGDTSKVGCAIAKLDVRKSSPWPNEPWRTEHRMYCVYDVSQVEGQRPVENPGQWINPTICMACAYQCGVDVSCAQDKDCCK